MFTTNPFAVLSSTVPSIALQAFVLLMLALVVIGTLMDIIHKTFRLKSDEVSFPSTHLGMDIKKRQQDKNLPEKK